MITYQLTGKKRYRIETRWLKKPLIVVQVEIHRKGYEVMDSYGGMTQDFDDYIWRDARLEDLEFARGEQE
tara:strand:- start:121 stop:330 length:210 start_codon:yes stop_codon:yes gene_type:complete